MNSTQQIGRLTRDPEMRFTQGGDPVANFSIAVDRAGDKSDDGYEAGFFDCVAFGKTADLIERFFHKGKQIGVEGRLQHHRWETKEGQKRSTVQIIVSNITFTGSKSDDEGGGSRERDPDQFVPNQQTGGDFKPDVPDDDIPF